jgi:hypothetical protein
VSEAFTCEPGHLRWKDPSAFPAHRADEECLAAGTLEWPPLPIVQPGQLWLVEISAINPELAPLEYRALTTANVVIYDRTLASTVSEFLPLGGYAELAGPGGEAMAERCIRFIRDGWSVARLVLPRGLSSRQRTDEVCRLADQLIALKGAADLPVSVFANVGSGTYQSRHAQISQLRAATIPSRRCGQSATLTIVFEAIEAVAGSRFSVASANGLAG